MATFSRPWVRATCRHIRHPFKDVVVSKYITSEFYHVSKTETNVEKAVFLLKCVCLCLEFYKSPSLTCGWRQRWMASGDICWLNSDTGFNNQRGQHAYQIERKEALVTFTKKTNKKCWKKSIWMMKYRQRVGGTEIHDYLLYYSSCKLWKLNLSTVKAILKVKGREWNNST